MKPKYAFIRYQTCTHSVTLNAVTKPAGIVMDQVGEIILKIAILLNWKN